MGASAFTHRETHFEPLRQLAERRKVSLGGLPLNQFFEDRVCPAWAGFCPRTKVMLLYWGIFTLGFYLGIMFFLKIFSSKEE